MKLGIMMQSVHTPRQILHLGNITLGITSCNLAANILETNYKVRYSLKWPVSMNITRIMNIRYQSNCSAIQRLEKHTSLKEILTCNKYISSNNTPNLLVKKFAPFFQDNCYELLKFYQFDEEFKWPSPSFRDFPSTD